MAKNGDGTESILKIRKSASANTTPIGLPQAKIKSSEDQIDLESNNTNNTSKPHVKRLRVGLIKKASIVETHENASFQADTSSQTDQPSSTLDTVLNATRKYFTVQWRKRSNKKNKSWEGDGYIVVADDGMMLKIQVKNGVYKPVGRSKKTTTDGIIVFGSYEAEVDFEASLDEIRRLSNSEVEDSVSSSPARPRPVQRIDRPMKKHKPSIQVNAEELFVADEGEALEPEIILTKSPSPPIVDTANESPFYLPCKDGNDSHVIVDPRLLSKLRQHQKDAIVFLYECLLGIRDPEHLGALLADEMGLGKTLTAITIIWTLLKQSPVKNTPPPLKKILICCPVTLIDNWRREFSKWLDINRIGILALNNKQQSANKDKQDITAFGKTKVYQVLIMSYEKVMSCGKELKTVDIDLLVCDEGHRLKSASNKTLNILHELNIPRKLILTGTPIQNDLNEYYTIINFVNPNILGSYTEFQKNFLKPILQARDKECFLKDLLREGKLKSQELISKTKSFVLRRTKDSIKNFLTDRTDVLVFCKPTGTQKSLFNLLVSSNKFNSVLGSESAAVLSMINVFRKICNLPSLVTEDTLYQQCFSNSNARPDELAPSILKKRIAGSKINVLIPLLLEFQKIGEKTVLISNFTQTLDLLELALSKLNLLFLRLDGSTTSNTRDQLVTKFNKTPQINVFLLSAKAGGVGLNLIGASRLILFDNDWNPLIDQQALARIHRDGQKRPVVLYRLFTAGCIDEKIFQRQLTKITLSDMFLDNHSDSNLNIFDYDDLRDLFTVNSSSCNTHDLLSCECSGDGKNDLQLSSPVDEVETDSDGDEPLLASGFSSALSIVESNEKEQAQRRAFRTALVNFKHYDAAHKEGIDTGDVILNKLIARTDGDITYCFTHKQEGFCA